MNKPRQEEEPIPINPFWVWGNLSGLLCEASLDDQAAGGKKHTLLLHTGGC